MAKRKARRFDLSGFKGLDIESFAMIETTGEDTILAAERCAMPDGSKVDENTFNILLRNQMIAGAIVEVDGEPVKGASCQAFLGWSSRTRQFVMKTFDFMNSVNESEQAAFQKLLEAPASEEPNTVGQSG